MISISFKPLKLLTVLSLSGHLLLISCSQDPKPVHIHEDEGEYCRMRISDLRFDAQIVNTKGKAYKFDAIECAANYWVENREDLKGAKIWVSDFNEPKEFLSHEEAVFIKSKEIQSPMGESLLALSSPEETEEHLSEYDGKKITWETILKNARND